MPTPIIVPAIAKRLVFFGAAQVGKSAIIRRFVSQTFSEHYKPTIEDMFERQIDYDGKEVKLQILDTGGSFNFPAMHQLALNNGDLFIVVYSPDDIMSYHEALATCDEIAEKRGHGMPIVVVANKNDVGNRQVRNAEAELMFCQWNTYHIESSAKEESSVMKIFTKCLSLLCSTDVNSPTDASQIVERKRKSLSSQLQTTLRSLGRKMALVSNSHKMGHDLNQRCR